MKMYLMVFGSGRTDTWNLEESEVMEVALNLLARYQEKRVTIYQDWGIYKSWYL